MNLENEELEAGRIDNSAVARAMLKKTGIQAILDREDITEVAVNQGGRIFFEGKNGWEYVEAPECNYANLKALANALSVYSGLKLAFGDQNPIASVVLPDGERGQILTHPATESGTIPITLRKPSKTRFTVDDYQNSGRFSKIQMAEAYQRGTIPEFMQQMKKCQREGNYAEFFKIAAAHNMNTFAMLVVSG